MQTTTRTSQYALISIIKSPRFTDPEGSLPFSLKPACHLFLTWAKLTPSAHSQLFIQRPFNIIFNLYLGFPSSLFPSRFVVKTLYFSPHMQYAPPNSCALIYNGNGAWQEAWSPLRNFTHPPTIYSPSGRSTSLSTLFSNRRKPSSSLKWKTKFRNPNKTKDKTTALNIFSFMFLNRKRENKTLKRLATTIPRI